MRVLVVENDSALGAFLKRGLEAEQYEIDVTPNGERASSLAQQCPYDLTILDANPPKDESLSVLQRLRSAHQDLPILILINRGEVQNVSQKLDLGADDFILKPFSLAELSARVRALLRRGARSRQVMLRIEDLELNRAERSVKRANRAIDLTPKEFSLLEFLMRNAGQRLTRPQIIEHVWNFSSDTMTNVVDVYINYLRKKVDAAADRKLIHTIRGIGYQLDPGPTNGNHADQRRRATTSD